ncbi:TauD/TfdA dioxygenase family protein [Rhizorhabdus argentea]|uniref:TauD/TfdA dioxygenase family protein n=1 Tax=Rhizorhabdus argentea TaxID=1387174 RepID=UPI0030ED6119
MSYHLNWKKLAPFGVEVHDIDLSQRLPEDTAYALRRLYEENHLLVFRNQNMSLAEQREAAGMFGHVFPMEEGVHYISNVRKDGYLGGLEIKFHSDLAYCEFPIDGIMLHAIEVDSGKTSTQFVDIMDAWRTLPGDLKDRAQDMRAVQMFVHGPQDNRYGVDTTLPHWSHRVARPHPRMGELCLYVMEESTRMIGDLAEQEGRALIRALCDHITRPETVYEHIWHMGDVVLWDNLACQHARGALNSNVPRTLQRQTLGSLTFKQQYAHLGPDGLAAVISRLGSEPG